LFARNEIKIKKPTRRYYLLAGGLFWFEPGLNYQASSLPAPEAVRAQQHAQQQEQQQTMFWREETIYPT
jgi:hypothetical protein